MALESGQRSEDAELWGDLVSPMNPREFEDVIVDYTVVESFTADEWPEIADVAAAGVVPGPAAAVGGAGPGADGRGADSSGPDGSRADGPVVEAAAAKQAETQAYEDAIEKAFGGKKGMADVGLPGLLFVVVYTVSKNLTASLWFAVGLALLMTTYRLFKRETLQHSLGGLAGVLVCAGFAKFSGRPQDFYLPGLLLNMGYAAAFAVSAAVRWPIVGVMLGPITGEMMSWRTVPGRMRAFTLATWLLAATFTLRVAVQLPLYLAGQTTTLGVTRLVMGYPLYLAALYACWQIIKQAPPPIKTHETTAAAEAAAAERAEGASVE